MRLHQKLFWLLVFLLPLQLGRHFWPNFSLVLGIRVDYLSPTIYLTDILIFLILILWSFDLIFNSKFSIFHFSKRYWWVVVIFIFFLVNALLAQNSGVALYKFVKIVEFSFLGLYIAKNHYTPSAIRYPLILAVAYSSIIAIAQFIKQASLGGAFWWLGERTFNVATPGIAKAIINGELMMRPYGTFPHPNVLAGFILVSMILIGMGCQTKGVRRKILYWVAMSLGVVAIVLSFSRSVWAVGLLTCFWLVIRGWRKIKIKKSMFYVLCSMFFIVGLLVYFGPSFSTNEAFFQRWQLIKAAVLMIKSASLTGVGLNNFIVRLPDYWPMTGFTYWLQPVHNIYLLIAAETGIVGLLIFLWFLFLTLKRLSHSLSIGHYPLVISLTAILLLGLVDHYWLTLQQPQLLFTIILGLAWQIGRGKK